MSGFTRQELWEIQERALFEANVEGLSEIWRRKYLRLAEAACDLDAYIARSTIVISKTVVPAFGSGKSNAGP